MMMFQSLCVIYKLYSINRKTVKPNGFAGPAMFNEVLLYFFFILNFKSNNICNECRRVFKIQHHVIWRYKALSKYLFLFYLNIDKNHSSQDVYPIFILLYIFIRCDMLFILNFKI